MNKSKLTISLEAKIADLRAYQEAFFCLQKGEKPVALSTGEGETLREVEMLGLTRMSGGVVVMGATVRFTDEWLSQFSDESDPYARDLARQVMRTRERAIADSRAAE